MERFFRLALFAAVILGLVLVPTLGRAQGLAAPGIVELEDLWAKQPDLDARTTVVQPTAEQRAAVTRMGAHASWNASGTPLSLINYQGYLSPAPAGDAATAARAWIRANRALFNLSDRAVTS